MGPATNLVYYQSQPHIVPSLLFGASGAPEEIAWAMLLSLLKDLMALRDSAQLRLLMTDIHGMTLKSV